MTNELSTEATDAAPSRAEQMKRFKARFSQDLSDFIERKKTEEPTWSASDWKVHSFHFFTNQRPQINFSNNKANNSFVLHVLPQDLTADERYHLRKFMNNQCEMHGFVPSKTRIASLNSEDIAGVRRLDNAAWNKWIEKHYETWLRNSERGLNTLEHRPLIEAEDVVTIALEKTQERLKKSTNPVDPLRVMAMEIMRVIHRLKQSRIHFEEMSIRPQSNSAKVNDESRTNWGSKYAANSHEPPSKEQIEKLLNAVKLKLNSRQQELLEVVLSNHEKNQKVDRYYLPSHSELAARMKPNKRDKPLSKETIAQYLTRGNSDLHGIATIIETTAKDLAEQDPDMELVSNYIVNLVRCGSSISGGREI